ncbi:MAG: hypothetical protein E6J88_02285 [Deltaproteobacteria bacterium]|nr:MAG: hypothetical protein E6J88_02285 [Deltaproteobacteria bacterium]
MTPFRALSTSAAAASEVFARFRLSSRAPLLRRPRASFRARLRTPHGVAEPMVESTNTARKTASEPSRKFCCRRRCWATSPMTTVAARIPASFP